MISESTLTTNAAVGATAFAGRSQPEGERAEELFRQQRAAVFGETDRLFARLLLLEWAVLLIVALLVAPGNWRVAVVSGHAQVWWAIFFGGAITLGPVALARRRPGAPSTRYAIAASQMMHSSLLIALSGGRMETHFHIFCSLLILSFYRDWRVLIPATAVVVIDHFTRGLFWPVSLFGTHDGAGWKSLEHCAWVLFEDMFLVVGCLRSVQEMRATASRTAALEASQHANEQIMKNSRDVICTNDAAGRFVTVSAACEALWGYTPEEIIGRSSAEMVHPDDREKSRLANLEIMAGNPVTNFENRYLRKDGKVVDVLWSAYWSESDGTLFQVARDISLRKQGEVALEKTNRQLASAHQANLLIMDNSQDVICSLDRQGRFLTTNAACRDLWGYEPEELIGRVYLVLVHPEDRAWSREAEEGTRARGKRSDFVNRCVRKDGSTVNVLWSASWSAEEEILVCVAHDVTEQQRVEKALRDAKEAADGANRAKSEFLSRMSHELRTPLNAILGFGQVLEIQNPRSNQLPHLHHILAAGRHLLELINEVLDISRIESDRLKLELTPVSLRVALQEALELIGPLAERHEVECCAPPLGEMDHFVVADPQRLKQVLLNLLGNGVKYTPAGGFVKVSCQRMGETVRISIRDSGIGIAPAMLPRAFTPFDRLGAERSGVEGTGLGLALSRRLVQAMQGKIGVESTEGKGSTFWIELGQTEPPRESSGAVVGTFGQPIESLVTAAAVR